MTVVTPQRSPLRAGWLPEGSGLDWLEDLRAEHEAAVRKRERLDALVQAFPQRLANADAAYRAAVRKAVAADMPIPTMPGVLIADQARVELDETRGAAEDAAEAVRQLVREAVVTLIDRADELEAAGDPVRSLFETVTEPVRVGAERAALRKALGDARAAGSALVAQFVAEDEGDRLTSALLANGTAPRPEGWQPGDVVPEVRRGDKSIVARQEARQAAQEAFEAAEDALHTFDSAHQWFDWPLARFASGEVEAVWRGEGVS